jgi:hypothetical protein
VADLSEQQSIFDPNGPDLTGTRFAECRRINRISQRMKNPGSSMRFDPLQDVGMRSGNDAGTAPNQPPRPPSL